jgi:GxxExxY protein
MNANEDKTSRSENGLDQAGLVERELVYRIVGCALAVHNGIGHGLREKTYESGLKVEFRHAGLACSCQHAYPVVYRGETIDEFVPDLVVEGRVILELKTVETITDEHRGQVLNYLRVTGLHIGLILNFKHPKFEWERMVLTANGREQRQP